jgi:hypothetical protein
MDAGTRKRQRRHKSDKNSVAATKIRKVKKERSCLDLLSGLHPLSGFADIAGAGPRKGQRYGEQKSGIAEPAHGPDGKERNCKESQSLHDEADCPANSTSHDR